MDAEKLLKEKRLAIIALACKHGAQSVRIGELRDLVTLTSWRHGAMVMQRH